MSISLQQQIRGRVINETDVEFNFYRSVWNHAADGIPNVIVPSKNNKDLSTTVQYAALIGKSVCVRDRAHLSSELR